MVVDVVERFEPERCTGAVEGRQIAAHQLHESRARGLLFQFIFRRVAWRKAGGPAGNAVERAETDMRRQ